MSQAISSPSNLLVVDDDSVSLSLLSKLAEKLGHQVLRAGTGSEAVELMNENAVDLVISDFEMPAMDGLELLKLVKMKAPRLPFILVTAYSNLRVIREAWEFGAFDFFQKPVFVDRLNQTIRLALQYGHLSIARRSFPKVEQLQPDADLIDLGVVRELAIALERSELLKIVEEFEVHARIELEQILFHSKIGERGEVHNLAHRLAGSSVTLGMTRIGEEMRGIEAKPQGPIHNSEELTFLVETSIYWLKSYLAEIFRDISAEAA